MPQTKEQKAAYMREYYKENREHLDSYTKDYRKKNKEKVFASHKEYRLKSKYGMTLKDQTILLQKQNNKCKICLVEFSNVKPNIDHCHTTNKVRGLLCLNCNTGLGHFKDNTKLLTKAINYLQENK
jgi:hypothetical protein|tara:strand:- start:1292 stop:1669 length:378 start_codon:yes stop_codon:yes gene_type:complete